MPGIGTRSPASAARSGLANIVGMLAFSVAAGAVFGPVGVEGAHRGDVDQIDILDEVGQLVDPALDGEQALDYLFASGPHRDRNPNLLPAVILLDLKLPRIDGLEVLRRIRANEATSLLPVVILTTSKEQQDIYEGYNLGANSYIRKPVDFEKFIQAVGQLGLYWLALNEVVDLAA